VAGKRHQFILGLIIKKIREDGFTIISTDGNLSGAFGDKMQLPPKILRHRPDVIAINEDGLICIGEAKTENDINSLRTSEEFYDYANTELNGKRCFVIIGIPQSSKKGLNSYLKKIGVSDFQNIFVLYVPNEIINE
jgi:hypothetical protein